MQQINRRFRLATVSDEGVHWTLRRNCSVSPRQLLGFFVLLSLLSLAVALFFWFQGATLVWPFSVLEIAAVGTAFLVYARHATDREDISLCNGRLVVELDSGGRVQRFEFASHGLRVESRVGDEQLVEVRGGGHSVRVGRHLRSDLRPALASEIRQAAQEL